MNVSIRKANTNDMHQVLKLIKALAHFEKEPDQVDVTIEELSQDGFGDNPAFTCFVAEIENSIEGMALVYDRYSTWKGVVLHLEDLIVSQNMRGTGIGTLLLDEVVRFGNEMGVKRISWEVIDWNEPAIAFYEKKGAKVMRDWDVVQLDKTGMEKYLNNINS